MSQSSTYDYSVADRYQSILDVFLLQGLINYQDYQNLKTKFSTNAEIESFLLKNQLISRDSINRAYSIIYKIPFIDLKNLKIEKSVLELLPKDVIRKYQIAPFSIVDNFVNVAFANAGRIENDLRAISELFLKKSLKINVYITAPSDIEAALKQYKNDSEDLLLTKAKYPTVFLKNQSISQQLINLLPIEYIKKYHLIIFGKRNEQNYQIATDLVDSPEVMKAIRVIEEQNKVKFEIFATSESDVGFVLESLKTVEEEPIGEDKIIDIQDKKSIIGNLRGLISSSPADQSKKITVDSVEKDISPSQAIPEDINRKKPGDSKAIETGQIDNKIKKSEKDKTDPATILTEDSEKDQKTPEASVSQKAEQEDIGNLIDHEITTAEELKEIVKLNQVPKIVAGVVNYAIFMRSSDIHMEPEEKDFRIRFRIDGTLQDIISLPLSIQNQIVSRVKILSDLKLDESRIPQDGRFDVNFRHRGVDIRVSTLPTVRGEKVVLRLLDKNQGILSLEDLGMVGRAFDLTLEAIKKPYGIIISTGPTSSGKSTTLYAMLNRISVPAVNIITLEDPVEYEIPGVNQCQIKPKIGFGFAEGLRSILRQDPNVIMVGEVRDLETASMATHAALTGHLVLTTLHTNNAAGALPRLANMGVEPYLITSSINLIIAQRLVRRICPKCREEVSIPAGLLEKVKQELLLIPENNKTDRARVKGGLKFYQGKGCNECLQGYRGRLGVFEVLRITDRIEEAVLKKLPASDILKGSTADGMITMRQDGILKALEGLTTIDEALRVSESTEIN
jgi:type IV pilus assembly protein PilB